MVAQLENSRNFCVEVGTHRLKARVSAAEKDEEATCYGGTFLKLCWRGGNSHFLW